MTSRERLLTVLGGEIPDCVPVAPDFSNMIPARRTGKPFWDVYLYNDPPQWQAFIDCTKHFNIDAIMDGFFRLTFPEEAPDPAFERYIVGRTPERIYVQWCRTGSGRRTWRPTVDVYYIADPPTHDVPVERIGLPAVPQRWEPVEGVKTYDSGPEGFKKVKQIMGDQGLVGTGVASTFAVSSEELIYRYYDHPEEHERWAAERVEQMERRFARIMAMDVKPDFLSVGGSGTLVYQTVEMMRKIAFPAVKKAIEMATAAGIPTHIHSCGPEKELVKIMAEETSLTIIDPLETPPMGDCDLAELKRLYGDRIVLKGNLHTTDVMLRGTVDEVIRASKKAIDDAAAGGRYVLSTGDQCGRDTPDENISAMIETARTYGRY
ncbi:MAG: uroporphyrinogen decarboxylase family protein [Armatimonadota bacterium]|jgi:uroporphyrinogen decarboxylase